MVNLLNISLTVSTLLYSPNCFNGGLYEKARREPAAQLRPQNRRVPLGRRHAHRGVRREVYAGGKCRLGAPRPAPQPHHPRARRARRQHHPRALKAQVRHRRARGLPQALDAPGALRARRRAAVCAAHARGTHAVCRGRARQQAALRVRQAVHGACIFSRHSVDAPCILFNFCRRIQRAHAVFSAHLRTFVVAQRAGRRPAQRSLLTLRTKKTKICGKIWL